MIITAIISRIGFFSTLTLFLQILTRACSDCLAHDHNGNHIENRILFYPDTIFADLDPGLLGLFGVGDHDSSPTSSINKTSFLGKCEFIYDAESIQLAIPFPFNAQTLHELNPTMPLLKPQLKARYVDLFTHRDREDNFAIYSHLKRGNRGKLMEEFVEELAKTFPMITGIDCIPYPNGQMGPITFSTKDQGLLPMYSFGEGMQRWFNLLGGMVVYQNAIHLIEEIDATFHPKAQRELAANLVHYSKKYDNQLFLTSHSLEFVDTLLDTIYGSGQQPDEDIVRIITLRNDPTTNEVKARVLTGQEAYESREKYHMELR